VKPSGLVGSFACLQQWSLDSFRSAPLGRVTFFARAKKVTKERRPLTALLRSALRSSAEAGFIDTASLP